MSREFIFGASSESAWKMTCTSRRTGRSCSPRRAHRWKIHSQKPRGVRESGSSNIPDAFLKRNPDPGGRGKSVLGFRHRRTTGELLHVSVSDVAQVINPDLA